MKISRLFEILSGLLLYGLSTSIAQAILITGDFSANYAIGSPTTTLSGSFQAIFDDRLVTGIGRENFSDLKNLTSFNLNPNPIGVTTLDTSNLGIDLIYQDGDLIGFWVGGLPDVSSWSGFTDDIFIGYSGTGAPVSSDPDAWQVSYTVIAEAGGFSDFSPSGSITITPFVVPIPPALYLFGSGLLGLIGIARRKKAA